MPSTRIMTGDWARERAKQIIETVQNALMSGLGIPDWDRDIVLNFYDEDHRIVPAGRSEKYTRIEITLYTGRTLDIKRKLYTSIVEHLSAIGLPKEDVKIILIEMAPENWGIRGGMPGSEVTG
ncbi:tautomerase family protein [Mesorhizobium sp. M7A.F.Ca.US.006.01.1.1]|uniref:tautomerase family protein n=1 Tax=Mesorhizobium sp. M7A.F.Ca.US.006.01.1.1 TaxID=2496707 RepID=UPI000FCAD687|nr:tautomerase family protein [Mesorhizobium sp. M7A.F.Ca.US.006.01.1.1]RUZ75998.1 tautomerase family protein [Mesorhizobium sp. M7A.F.Ca.US.006.01.1.1]